MTFQIEISDPSLTFNAAHFVSFLTKDGKWRAERIHGHDFRFSATIEGEPDETACVLDFVAATEAVRAVLKRCEHKIFVGLHNWNAFFTEGEGRENEYFLVVRDLFPPDGDEVPVAERMVLGPRDDFLILDVANASTEAIASYLLGAWLKELESSSGVSADSFTSVRVRLEEAPGYAAVVSRP